MNRYVRVVTYFQATNLTHMHICISKHMYSTRSSVLSLH